MMEYGSLEYWRNYFQTANTDIFDVIEHAILVAVSDYPNELRLRRERISEGLFSWRLTRSVDLNPLRSAVSSDDKEDGGCKCSFSRKATELGDSTKESKAKAKSGRGDEINRTEVSNFSFGEDEGLTGEIEKKSMIVAEILRIKEIVRMEEADSVLFESLRRLQPLALTVDLLKIGKAVNHLKKHGSKEIRQLAQTLIGGWKEIVDEWIKSTEAIEAKGTPDSINPSVINEEEELPSPPLDEVAMRQSKPVYNDSSSGRQPKSSLPQKSNTGPKMEQKPKKYVIRRRPLVAQQDCQKFKCSDDVSVHAKLEATKRKLHDSYQQAANAKKQRTIRVLELHDLPKQGKIGPRNPHSKLWKVLGRRR